MIDKVEFEFLEYDIEKVKINQEFIQELYNSFDKLVSIILEDPDDKEETDKIKITISGSLAKEEVIYK